MKLVFWSDSALAGERTTIEVDFGRRSSRTTKKMPTSKMIVVTTPWGQPPTYDEMEAAKTKRLTSLQTASLVEALQQLQFAPILDDDLRIRVSDGASRGLVLKTYFNSISITWDSIAPREWSGVEPLVSMLFGLVD